jgi:hypothetical protein
VRVRLTILDRAGRDLDIEVDGPPEATLADVLPHLNAGTTRVYVGATEVDPRTRLGMEPLVDGAVLGSRRRERIPPGSQGNYRSSAAR